MKVIITGATGMVGEGVLLECLENPAVERVLSRLHVEPAWLRCNDSTALRIAQRIRDEGAFELLPILADALQEAGCDNAEILAHCRASASHQQTCWVIELLLGPSRKRRGNPHTP